MANIVKKGAKLPCKVLFLGFMRLTRLFLFIIIVVVGGIALCFPACKVPILGFT